MVFNTFLSPRQWSCEGI